MFFDKLRAGAQGTVSKVILGLIIISFALAGVGSYVSQPKQEVAAVVNGEDISAQALENGYRNERARLEDQLGPQFSELLSDPLYVEQLRRSVLEQLIEQRLIDQKVAELGIYASDNQVREAIRALPEFQEDGQFSNSRYQQLLARSGISAEQLRDNIRQDLSRQLLVNTLLDSSFSLTVESGLLDKLSRQQRSGEIVRIPLAKFAEQVQLSEEQVKAYYEENLAKFQRPEQVKINYLLLDSHRQASDNIDDAAIEAEYQANIEQYRQPGQRELAHIMLTKSEDAKAKLKAIAKRIAEGESFAELAKTESEDAFSGEQGGNLGWIEEGTLDPAFDNAAFALKEVGDVSEVVESNEGFHLITLLDKKEAKTQPLAEVRERIAARLAKEQAANDFYEQEQRLADLVFEFPDSLDMAAQELGLSVVSTDFFSAEDAPTPLNDQRVISKAFAKELREQDMNSEVIELGDNKAIVIHVLEQRPAAPREFAEVKDKAREQATTAATAKLAEQAASELQTAWANNKQDAWLAEQELSVEELKDLTRESEQDSALLTRLFAMPSPSEDSASIQKVTLTDASLAVVKLNKVVTPKDDSELQAQIQEGQAGIQGQKEFASFIMALKSSAKIKYGDLSSSEEN
ncbi:SurA N-terminal domain-containing protein [Oceanisphaera avium]|uniref:Periplasmic chaperone PpiD n=1 Tax=Oceanisphaera avium TaxID=1903694 RepID=A0A1Y0CWX1_9GAMM|nr:SurA N-terminal domain-containing protein [Oceanisphaera avium]ART79504.1 peptidylprolyl isomerase [Oceanisphaera avium]